MKPLLLVLNPLPAHALALFEPLAEVIHAPDAERREAAIAAHGPRVRAVLTIGSIGLTAPEMDRLPALALVCALGVGYEGIDVAHARQRGIALANGAGVNSACVADHAFALMLAVVRAIPAMDRATRAGIWRDALPMQPQLAGKRLGLLGLGAIGRQIARRAEGFSMPVGYHARSRRDDAAPTWFETPLALAAWCDVLVVATPGGAGTHHLVGTEVLRALGPRGWLVNVARGSVVDTEALAAALADGSIAGAGLDVYESEPAPPLALIGFDNLVITPHLGGNSPEALQASLDNFVENLRRHLAGEPLATPI